MQPVDTAHATLDVPALSDGSRLGMAYDFIKRGILVGTLAPGVPLRETALADEIGLSRTPVREALRALEREGLIRIDPGRGARVTEIDTADIRDIYGMRLALEHHAIRTICAERTPGASELLCGTLARQESALRDDDPQRFFDADGDFHMAILTLAGNRRMTQAMSGVWDAVVRCAYQVVRKYGKQSHSLQEHQEIFAAITEFNVDAAIKASERHVNNSVRRVLLP